MVLDAAKFEAAIKDCKKLMAAVEETGIRLTGGLGDGQPKVSKHKIWFNGNPSHETFAVDQVYGQRDLHPDEAMKFAFCKTAQKPYDLAVMGCLLTFKRHLGKDFRVSSDGDATDWKPGFDLVRTVLGYAETFLFGDDGIEVTA